jgi:glutamine amidotransferase
MAGTCTRLPSLVKVPHVGWNDLQIVKPSRLLADITTGAMTYFTHSYAAPLTPTTVASAEYGSTFTAVVEDRNIFGVQFHPEKSADIGLRILRSFVEITRSPDREITRC